MQDKQIKGVVANAITKQPVPGQKVELTIITQKLEKTSDPEWPNGKPVYSYTKYQTTSDQAGHYSFDVRIPYLPWSYNVTVQTGDFIVSYPLIHTFPIDEIFLRLQRDSVFIERPGYVRYSIKTPGAHQNETLYVSTPHHRQQIWPNYNIVRLEYYFQYNWAFPERTDRVIMDTIPAESITDPEIQWLRVLPGITSFDTVTYKRDTIHVQAGSTTNYSIQY